MRRYADPNITPLIDVLLVLLVIFMVTVPLGQQGLDLSVPQEAAPPGAPAPQHIVLQYTADRALRLNSRPVAKHELAGRLRDVFADRRDRTLFVDGDGSIRYGEIVWLIDAARGAGVERVGVITEGMRAGR